MKFQVIQNFYLDYEHPIKNLLKPKTAHYLPIIHKP